jgi:3-dehydroquinate dehydratase-2
MKILVINGPNLNLLGRREPSVYGTQNLHDVNNQLLRQAQTMNVTLHFLQSNHEGEIVDAIHQYMDEVDGILINPASLSQSYSISEAIKSVGLPAVEVHMSNIYAREEWHSKSVIVPVAVGQIVGFKATSYVLGLQALVHTIQK